jgi:hypothetical protein
MTRINQQLDHVIKRVNQKLFKSECIIPVKTEDGILVGNVLIVSRDSFKDLYRNNELLYKGIALNKIAIKVANLAAIDYMKHHTRIEELIRVDIKFGQSLEDYQHFKTRYFAARTNNDQFKIDLYGARMTYAKDGCKYWKKQADTLTAK